MQQDQTIWKQKVATNNTLHAPGISLTGNTDKVISTRAMNTLCDNDWFYLDVTSASNFDTIVFSLDSASVLTVCGAFDSPACNHNLPWFPGFLHSSRYALTHMDMLAFDTLYTSARLLIVRPSSRCNRTIFRLYSFS